ncbi:MAG TPA: pyridoxal-phosphate dependent enzyme [Pyrinomonadaceae bacterium]|nr:pyridoxal-phosphate dependent enzyme [Chloracidobacterium sp.]MBP9935471.1 pyridoxal-phosphate dependent enzyme [Pyrinomonadaceae bacterium]MBK7801914.1 pyridoxal-phosphate dependent enzyme [Chloracidobacterium sp.]MBK9437943.1 pyridoxal-phosphate dependent enzyme [Chloracidobacterium sp.]MBK9765629.1 pyridoxal-phosphate dependent enzyme [Chloracidobacterium sp.]
MKVYNDILELIGDTPLVRINNITKQLKIKAPIYAKMESLNPGYSVKDRIGISMIDWAEREGVLKKGGTIIEATSGNTGIGLALVAAVRGYKCIFVLTEKASTEKVRYLKGLGADIVVCPAAAKPGTPDHYVATAKRISEETPNSFYPDQYNHPENPAAHYRTTGPEIWNDTDGKITHFVASIGTGGTISGTGRYLKEMNPDIKVIGADPYGSIFKTYKESGFIPEATPYLVEGIGQNLPVGNADLNTIDEIINITDRESFDLARQLGRREGIFCGGSAGTIFAAALKVAKDLDESACIVFIVCDTGEHYLSKFHSDEWMKEKLLLEPQRITASLIADTKSAGSPRELISVGPDEKVAAALALMSENSVTQLPVIDGHESVGSLRESHILTNLLKDRNLLDAKVSDIMDKSFPVVDVDESFDSIKNKLTKSPAVVIEDFKRITGIITRSDVLDLPH